MSDRTHFTIKFTFYVQLNCTACGLHIYPFFLPESVVFNFVREMFRAHLTSCKLGKERDCSQSSSKGLKDTISLWSFSSPA